MASRTRTRAVRATEAEWQRWKSCVEDSGGTLNGFIRESANRCAELQEALRRQEKHDREILGLEIPRP